MQCRNSEGDGGRPSGAALQGEASNSPELLRSRAVVVSVREKAPQEASCMEQRDERKRTTDDASKTLSGDIKTGSCIVVRDEIQRVPADWLGGVRCGGGVKLFQALSGNVGTCRADVKGDVQVSATRARVPMRCTGAEQPVVVMKSGNADGAKGLRHSVSSMGQPERGGAYG